MPEVKIGLEIHGYLNVESKAKLFCDCKKTDAEPNSSICPICTGMPGSKPMAPNKEAVIKLIEIAGLFECRINQRLIFQRKHYDWPDMPTGYQRTISGSHTVPVGEEGDFLGIGMFGVHLEEDPAKWDPETGLVDYNRSGLPLVEIVTKPDFTSSEQVRTWLKNLVTTLSYIKAIDPDSGLKSDVNVSICPDFKRVEIKNVNSFKSIIQSIEHEIKRQTKEIKEGNKIGGETRAWEELSGTTVFMRKKEQAAEYMHLPEPDLPAVKIPEEWISKAIENLPEKPSQKIKKYTKELKLDKIDAEIISSNLALADLFEKVAQEINPVIAGRWFRKELLRVLNYNKKELEDIEADEKHLIQLLKLVEQNKITGEVARKMLEKLVEKPFDVEEHVKKEKLIIISDSSALEKYAKESIEQNPKAASDYKSGNEKALNFLMGDVMKRSKAKASPQEVIKILKDLIK